ncbi:MAG: electron transport complex subunit RsxA [Peptococcia bacterium]
MNSLFLIIVGAIFVNNIVFSQFLGICPFLGVSKNIKPALGMGAAVIFVMTVSSPVCWLVQEYILVRFNIEYLQTITFILVIAALVQFVELVVKKYSPTLYKSLGVYLPLITTNCAVLGVAILNIQKSYSLLEATVNGAANAIGFTLALIMMAGIRERLEAAEIPKALGGIPISLVIAGFLSIAFMGFAGLL